MHIDNNLLCHTLLKVEKNIFLHNILKKESYVVKIS